MSLRVELDYEHKTGKAQANITGEGVSIQIAASPLAYVWHVMQLVLQAPAAAFSPEPPPACMGDSGEFNGWENVPESSAPELSPEVEALIERDADSDMGLRAGEAG